MGRPKHRWLPGRMAKKIEMGQLWAGVLQERGAEWGIPAGEIAALADEAAVAADWYRQSWGPYATDVLRLERNNAIKTLVKHMELIKRRWFFIPPLAEPDFTLLGLPVPSGIRTRSSVPKTAPAFYITIKNVCFLLIRFYDGQTLRRAIPYGYHGAVVYWDFGGESPPSRSALRFHKDATRSPFLMQFDIQDRGKRVWIALRWINEKGEEGPWSEIQWAIIP